MPSFSQSRIAAKLQDNVAKRREEVGLYKEIAEELPLAVAGRLLDVGTGSGLQLKVIHEMEPNIELFGLDISEAAIRVARANLEGIEVDLRVGSIEDPPYDDDFFDVVTCNASMSYWKNPVSCFDEIYRILKPGGSAILFEPQKDIDMEQVVETIRTNLADESWLRRCAAVSLNKFGLRWGRKLGLKLYALEELKGMARQSPNCDCLSIERFTLQKLPIFARIALIKPGEAGRCT
jgi:ubiquinone/menaquinone biosynthesis C-methylase UbiE